MDLSKLSIQFLCGYELQIPLPDGFVQKDKLLPHFSVVYPLRGYYELTLEDGDCLTVPPDGCFLVPAGVRHHLLHRAGADGLLDRWLLFSVLYQGALDVTGWFHPRPVLSGEEALPFRHAVDASLQLSADPHRAAFQQLRIAAQLLEALWEVSEFRPEMQQLDRIYPAVELIRDRYHQHLTVEDMAKACGMSVSAFHRAFLQSAKRTPMQYLNDHRLKTAAGLLLQGKLTLSEIAERCGFCDEFHLSHNFKRSYGVSPRDYRRSTLR